MDRIEERIIAIIDSNRSRILDFANDIYHNAELGYKEFRTSEKFQKFMEERVGRVEDNLAVTGVKAYLNEGKKENFSLALIGELDALRIPDHKCVNTKTEAAHCCGHHAQLAGVI
ncbi:MAG TPA: amidohydrolase, partial [Candidatus Pelethocola excrementipullorum]|nr:amidohydrolase [Candidatus Pelethocola excrementipullorum]